MATKLEHLHIEKKHFHNSWDKLNDVPEDYCQKTVNYILNKGFMQVSTVFEEALAARSGTTVVSENTHDLSDGSDGKLSTVRTSGYGKSYTAPVTNIYGKTGTLRVQVYERKKDKFYYFSIPNSAYRNIPRTSNIEIPFELDGTPRRISKGMRIYANWWDFECDSFYEMANK